MERAETITDKKGNTYILKKISAEHAEQYLDFMHQVSGETHYMLRYDDEIVMSEKGIDAERERIRSLYEDERQGMFSVFDGERIIGNIAVRSIGKGRKTSHRCSIGLGVRKEHHGAGLGTILIEHAISFAVNAGYEMIELGVMSDNEPAYKLYVKMGFEECGRLPDAVHLDDGKIIDEISMFKRL